MSYCKGCSTSYTGFRCPNCGRPRPAAVCLTILIPMIVGLSLLAWAIPDEVIPRLTTEKNGNTRYVFQAIQTAILWPAGAGLLLFLIALQRTIFKTKSLPTKPQTLRSGVWRVLCMGGKRIRYFILSCCFLILGFLFSHVILLTPLTRFRQADLSDRSVVCSSLFRTREILLVDIAAIQVEQEEVNRRGRDYLDCRIVIHTRSKVFRSVDISLRIEDADLPRFTDMMAKCVADINNRRQASQSMPVTPNGAPDG